MSGLFGYFDPRRELPDDTIERMAAAMTVPADRGGTVLSGDGFAIACLTKAIYPLEGQVLSSPDGNRQGLMIGRLLGLAGQGQAGGNDGSTDDATPARQTLIESVDAAGLAACNGPFAAALWDQGRRQLELITDRYGMYPLYVARHESALLFASQIRALLATGLVPREVDPLAVTLLAAIGEMVGDITPIRAVRLLPAASRTILTAEGMSRIGDGESWTPPTESYWSYTFDQSYRGSFTDAADEAGQLLRRAVQRICAASGDDSPIGVPLSGGLDSRVLLAATPRPAEVPSFTWGLEGCRDLRYAAAAARALGSPHRAYVYDGGYLQRFAAPGVWMTEGQLPVVDFHVLPYVEEVSRHCHVILNGYAGDALLGGNFVKRTWWHAASKASAAEALWAWRNTQVPGSLQGSLFGATMRHLRVQDAREAFVSAFAKAPGSTPMDAAMAFLLDNRVRRRTSGGTSLLRIALESEHPFFDHDFFDFLARLPHDWRFRHRLYRTMLRRCFPNMARVPWQRTGLPAGAPTWQMYAALALHKLERVGPLRRFFRDRAVSDFPHWFRGPLRPLVSETLLGSVSLDRGWINPDVQRSVVADHLEGRADHTALIGALLTIELFARLFIDQDTTLIEPTPALPPMKRVTMSGAAGRPTTNVPVR